MSIIPKEDTREELFKRKYALIHSAAILISGGSISVAEALEIAFDLEEGIQGRINNGE